MCTGEGIKNCGSLVRNKAWKKAIKQTEKADREQDNDSCIC